MHHAPGPHDDFANWELELIRREAEVFFARRRPRWADVDDLVNAALLAWWHQRERYDPSRGAKEATYLKLVALHAMEDVVKPEETHLRSLDRNARSFEEPVGDGDETVADFVADPKAHVYAKVARIELIEEVMSVAQLLSTRQRRLLVLLLDGEGITAASRAIGVHRDTLYDERKRIGEVFRRHGFGISDS